MKKQKKDKRRQSTQQLMGIQKITDYCISTDADDLVFYIIKPTNISVLPAGAVSAKIRALQNTLSAQAGVELLAMNSRESFNATCLFYHDRMQAEQNPAIRELLEQDRAFLDEKQVQMTLAREFYLAVRLKNEKPDTAYTLLVHHRDEIPRQRLHHAPRRKGRPQTPACHLLRAEHHDGALRGLRRSAIHGGDGMSIFRRKKQTDAEAESLKSFLDMIAPSIVKFETGYYICGNTFRCIWALREYPTSTDDLAILRHLGEKHGVTLHIYTRMVSPLEERKIVHNAEIRNRMNRGSAQDMQRAVEAESNLQDVANLIGSLHRNKEPLLHCAVYIEMIAGDMQELQILQTNVEVELMRSKLNVDRLKLRQQAGFCAVSPVGFNVLGTEYERVLPASSVANLFPFNYSGKTDRKGFYIGKDKYGSNIVVDFDQRDEDKTSANVLILGNSGQGKSYLMKLLLLNFLEAGKSVITLDVEHEQWELCQALGGCFADIIEGTYKINLLEPRCWDTDADPYDVDAPKAFRQSTRLAQHTSFLKDVFRTYKDFTTAQIDTIEIMLTKLYTEWGITEETDFSQMRPKDYPILSELYDFIEIEYENFDETKPQLYTRETLQQILLGLHSMCRGADSKFFNGHTNLTSTRFLVFGVKGLLSVAQNVRSTILLNLLSYMSDKLLTEGNTVAALDELYIWLSNPVAIEYIRNSLKRVRKKESALVLASQNLEDFDQPGVREMTKPLFSIPPHQFLFNAGSIDRRAYMDMLQLDDSEFDLIKFPQRGVCLYKCGNERYLLEVHAPPYKEALFGKAGGR